MHRTGESHRKPRVLIVEDDPGIRRAIPRLLGDGFHCESAEGAMSAIEKVQSGAFSILLSDIHLGDGDGVEVAGLALENEWVDSAVLMTSLPTARTAMRGMELGVARYLEKSELHTRLRQTIRSVTETLRRKGASRRHLIDVLRNRVSLAFQPIVETDSLEVFAYEALLRTRDAELTNPLELVQCAEQRSGIYEVGRRVRELVAERIESDIPPECDVFVNIHPLELNDPEFFGELNPLLPFAKRIVFEITERGGLEGIESIHSKVDSMRDSGFRFALDDVGAASAGLNEIRQIEPEFVKIDRTITLSASDQDTQAYLIALSRLTQGYGGSTVLEGIEDATLQKLAGDMGIGFLQGYAFGRPSSTPWQGSPNG